jgi:hypothetical protein
MPDMANTCLRSLSVGSYGGRPPVFFFISTIADGLYVFKRAAISSSFAFFR